MPQTGAEKDEPFAVIGNTDPLFENDYRVGRLDLFKEGKVVFVGNIYTHSGFRGEQGNPFLRMFEVSQDIIFDNSFGRYREQPLFASGEIVPVQLPVISSKVAEKIHFLEGGAEAAGIRRKVRI